MSEIISAPAMIETPAAPRGLFSWIATVDHKRIGILYLLTTLVFFVMGGVEALLMRIQLARPNNTFLSPDARGERLQSVANPNARKPPSGRRIALPHEDDAAGF